ncbi:MAG: tetratricopeptide repeat protein [Chthoniobacterales bacterium]
MIRRIAITVVAFAGLALAEEKQPKPEDDANYVPLIAREAAGEGNDAFDKGDYKSARSSYQKVLDLAPGNLVALVNLGLIEFRSGNDAAAEKVLKQAITKRIETAPAWLTLGMLYVQQNHNEEAFAALSQAVLYDRGNPRAHNYLGIVLGRKGWLDGAEAELRRAVEIDPSYRDAHYNLAVVYLQRKPPSVELARRHYYKSIELGGQQDKEIEKKLFAAPPAP